MKKLLLVIGILIAANIVFAQEVKSAEERAVKFKEKLRERMELAPDQETQLKELREKYRPELRSIRNNEEKSKSEKLYAAAVIVEQREKDLAKILSEKQLQELRTIKNEVRQKKINRQRRLMKRRRGN